MNNIIALLLLLLCLCCRQLPAQADADFNIRLYRLQHAVRIKTGADAAACDGVTVPLAAASFNLKGVSYLPLRSAVCLSTAEIGWNSQARQAELSFVDKWGLKKTAGFSPDDSRAFFGASPAEACTEEMGYPSILRQGRLFVPARYLALLLSKNLHYSGGELIFFWNEDKAETVGIPETTDKAEIKLSMLCACGIDSPDLVLWRGEAGQGILKREKPAGYVVINGKRYDRFEPVLQLEPGANNLEVFAAHVSTGAALNIVRTVTSP